tara:strand:- start:441 stop:1508 length:1068 start_codon:yes stop_codon:yes gene_type:complete
MLNKKIHRRLDMLRGHMTELHIECVLVTTAANRRYLSGFTGSAGALLITADRQMFITDGRYKSQGSIEAVGFELIIHSGPILREIVDTIDHIGVDRIGVDPDHINVTQYRFLKSSLNKKVTLVDTCSLVENMRLTKDEHELEAMRSAIEIADNVMQFAFDQISRSSLTEKELALAIDREFRLHSDGPAFPLIVASGLNSAKPHHFPSDAPIVEDRPLVIDIGASVQGYCSDITRTFCPGGSSKFDTVYSVVLEANAAGISAVKHGADCQQVDRAARDIIDDAGYGEFFGHGLGHGVGLEIHESPRLSMMSDDVLLEGTVHSIEPGIYLPDWGGVRIEDLVLVTRNGSEVLTQAIK